MSPPVNLLHAKAAVPAADSALGQLDGQTKFKQITGNVMAVLVAVPK